jgi:ATP:corrinoid adenosyltransferase BtuR/CobO/CobP
MTDAADRHKGKMARRKAQDAEVASKPILEKGLLIVRTGPGKGKSTAAFGLALRAPGLFASAWRCGLDVTHERVGLARKLQRRRQFAPDQCSVVQTPPPQ